MRHFYSLAWLFLLPFAFLHLLRRARRQPEYLAHWRERLGLVLIPPGKRPLIWLHAVSVGETRAAAPLVKALAARHPDHAILLTHATPTGRATGAELFGAGVIQAYLPYDFPPLVWLFLRRARPVMGVIMETEIWPNLYAACAHRGIPLFLVNARLSEKSARGYARFRALVAPALRALAGIAAQTMNDAHRLRELGAEAVEISGNVKFDVTPPADSGERARELRELFHCRFVLLLASTREGEEAMLLDALASLELPGLLLLLVPRHPQRFDEVAALLAARGLAFVRRGEKLPPQAETRVFLGDSMGELAAYYAAADLAYVGGSLLPLGGQNLIEAAAAGCPALIGPHTWNFAEAADQAVACGAALRVADASELAAATTTLFHEPMARERMREAGLQFAAANRGATERVMAMLERGM
ncbi:MAG: lipid IV(A) 3-deoxy-D-manno-octulosonic acid transferase [Pseudomonadota bacterium]|nr:lipid IV(A) 3-deoxy-D-manno-octulosonic acid transferase [Pseudomonadota bacterium]MDP1905883.1 lipid IV(A) 3-deoxy-D-manno-octulosonic acid transferase [Pseudomonadota bacterium]MDP2351755.1 lipid IV(A) 3-deoxy-D-manno-octulosonic acid transferase [Pseudomonadota bacterium]